MAIDDNKVYGLLGSQIKDLPDKIKAVQGLAKVLTTADYNYPTTGTKTSVALWLLPPGTYAWEHDFRQNVYISGSNLASNAKAHLAIVGGKVGEEREIIVAGTSGSYGGGSTLFAFVVSSAGTASTWSDAAYVPFKNVVDDLVTDNSDKVLSAKQGKVLKGLIDAITGFSYEVVQTLPASGQNGKIYLVPIDESGGPSTNYYDEYIWVNNAWEQIGTTEMDLTNYVQFSDLATVATTGDYDDLSDKPTIPSVVQSTGTSTTDVMSQNATTSMVFADPSSKNKVQIGNNSSVSTSTNGGLAISKGQSTAHGAIAIGNGWNSMLASGAGSIGIGSGGVYGRGSISLGAFCSNNDSQGVVQVGTTETNYGYNNSNYRLLTGLYDPQSDHDAATKGYVDTGLSAKADSSSLATVATSGSYSDLSNKPTIPTVNDSTITVTNNGTTVDSFTTNASSDKTIALSAPVITMTDTDPGEGSALAANNYVAVYGESGLIDTADIATGAVTASKIDFTSFNSTSVGGVASTVISNAGATAELRLFRVGNLVMANGTFVLNSLGTYDQFSISNTVPLGFRPSLSIVDNTNKIYLPFTGSTSNINGGWTVSHDGEMWFSISTAFSGAVRFFYNSFYLTDDDFPSQS